MLPIAFVLLLLVQLVRSKLVNRTIDDADGDEVTGTVPKYASTDSGFTWNARNSQTPPGTGTYNPDPSKMFKNTWHDGSAHDGVATITINFSGVAVYVFYTLIIHGNDYTCLNFTLDGQTLPESNFFFDKSAFGEADDSSIVTFTYNQMVFSQHSLSNGEHNLVVSMNPISNPMTKGAVDVSLFDYVIYTQDVEDDPPTNTITFIPPIITGDPKTSVGSSTLVSSRVSNSTSTIVATHLSSTSSQSTTSSDSVSPPNSTGSVITSSTSTAGLSHTSNITQTPENLQASSSSSKVGIIVGSIGGGLLLLLGLFIWRRRQKVPKHNEIAQFEGLPVMSPPVDSPRPGMVMTDKWHSRSALTAGEGASSAPTSPSQLERRPTVLRAEIAALQERVQHLENDQALPEYASVAFRR